MRILSKAKRAIFIGLSKLCVIKAKTDYMGKKLKFPVIYGMGRGYFYPQQIWMFECLQAFVQSKKGGVVDVGANVGLYLVQLRVISDDVWYYGFEPLRACNFYLQELIPEFCTKLSVNSICC